MRVGLWGLHTPLSLGQLQPEAALVLVLLVLVLLAAPLLRSLLLRRALRLRALIGTIGTICTVGTVGTISTVCTVDWFGTVGIRRRRRRRRRRLRLRRNCAHLRRRFGGNCLAAEFFQFFGVIALLVVKHAIAQGVDGL